MADLTLDQINGLFNKGFISENTYKNYVEKEPVAQPELDSATPVETMPSPTVQAQDGFVKSADETRNQKLDSQRAMLKKQQEAASQREIEAKQAIIDQRQKELDQKKMLAKQAGFSDEEIAAKIGNEEKELSSQRAQFTPAMATSDSLLVQPKQEIPEMRPLELNTDPMQALEQEQKTDVYQLNNDLQTGMQNALLMQQQAVINAETAGKAKAAEEFAINKKTAEEYDRLQKVQALKDQEEQEKLLAEKQKLDSEAARVASLKVDPDKFWSSKTTADKIGIGIGLILGAFGSGQSNGAVRVLEDAINKDIEAQRLNIANEREGVEKKINVFSQMKSVFKDNTLARQATRVALIDKMKMDLQTAASKYSSAEVQANAQNALAQLEIKKQQAQQEFFATWRKMQPVDGGINPMMLDKEQQEKFVPGYGIATSKEAKAKFEDNLITANIAKEDIKRLLAIADTPGKSVSPDLRAEAQTIANTLKGSLRTEIVGPGAVTEYEQKILDSIVANPATLFSLDSANKTRLSTILSRIDRNLKIRAKVYGLSSSADTLGFKPKGQ